MMDNAEIADVVQRLTMLSSGLRHKNELRVGPQMSALAMDDARAAILAISAKLAAIEAARVDADARNPLSAAVMLERAAAWLDSQALTDDELRQGYGFTMDYPDVAAKHIRALSTEISDADLDAAALARPKVRELVEALGYLVRDMVAEDREDFASVIIALSATAALGVRL